MIIDKLHENVQKKGCVCVGLDTDVSYLPESLLCESEDVFSAIYRFNCKIIDSTLDICAAYKVQIAYYEALGVKGLVAYRDTLKYLRNKGALTIADVKRGDIAKTAEMYAQAHFSGDFESDFMTVNPYMGLDTLDPYLPYLKNDEKGLFVLVRTSNPGANDFEYIETIDSKRLYEKVGSSLESYAKSNELIGNCGFSSIGAVMGCTQADEIEKMRISLNNTFFLIPGYGAQGGKAEDVAKYLSNKNGGIVNSSRAILLAYKKNHQDVPFDEAARLETMRMRDEIFEARSSI